MGGVRETTGRRFRAGDERDADTRVYGAVPTKWSWGSPLLLMGLSTREEMTLKPRLGRAELLREASGSILEQARIVGTY